MEWTHTQTIDAPAEIVWGLATNVVAWPEFIPTVQSVERLEEGPLRLGARAKIKQPGQRLALWTVTELTPVLGPVLGPLMRRVLRTENACFADRAQQESLRAPHAG